MNEDLVVDFLGRVINVGDEIVYPGARGSTIWMNHARVEKIEQDYDVTGNLKTSLRVTRLGGTLKQVTVYCLDRVVRL